MVRSTPERPGARPRDSSVSSWPRQEHQMASPAASPGVSPAGAARRSPRKPARPVRTPQFAVEEDPAVLSRRQKQIEYGKNTLAYQQYVSAVPRAQRLGYHPRTPVKRRVQSRRRWDNAVKCWRVHLHYWNDPEKLAELRGQESASDASSVASDRTESDSAALAAAAEAGAEAADGTASAEAAGSVEGAESEAAVDWADDVEGLAMELAG